VTPRPGLASTGPGPPSSLLPHLLSGTCGPRSVGSRPPAAPAAHAPWARALQRHLRPTLRGLAPSSGTCGPRSVGSRPPAAPAAHAPWARRLAIELLSSRSSRRDPYPRTPPPPAIHRDPSVRASHRSRAGGYPSTRPGRLPLFFRDPSPRPDCRSLSCRDPSPGPDRRPDPAASPPPHQLPPPSLLSRPLDAPGPPPLFPPRPLDAPGPPPLFPPRPLAGAFPPPRPAAATPRVPPTKASGQDPRGPRYAQRSQRTFPWLPGFQVLPIFPYATTNHRTRGAARRCR